MYAEHLTGEKHSLIKKVEEMKLDLDDAVQSRRELQKRLEFYQKQLQQAQLEHSNFEVSTCALSPCTSLVP